MNISGVRGWILFVTALGIVAAWPPDRGRSLLLKTVNWAVDPGNTLPVLPPQLGFGLSDDVREVEERDAVVRRYDEMYDRDAMTRRRMDLKVAKDPFNPSTERQWLLVVGVVVAFATLRRGSR